ncbi:MAG TPA: helix-turn-helix domain-containing protein [Pseudonocardia sp.]|nr:helix-turn-helix domain-containing protein [Pseudonocardia sp.]
MGVDEASVDERLSALATVVFDDFTTISKEITKLLLREISELKGDDHLERQLYASVEENVSSLLHVLELRGSLDKVAAPNAAAEYARRLAQRGVSVIALVRAYRVGHARFLDRVLAELYKRDEDPLLAQAVTQRALQLSFRYIDRVSEQVVGAYQLERDRWLLTQTAVRASRVKRLLAHEDLDVDTTESALGYRLRQCHVAVIGWVPESTQGGAGLVRLDRLGQALAADLGCAGRPLFVPIDESIAWFWLPFGARTELDWARLAPMVESYDPSIRVGVGELERGVDGFRASHYQAVTAQNVAAVAQPPHRVTLAEQVGPVALMCRDIEATRVWVQKVLGPLATDRSNHRALRDTLRVFLESGRSYAAAAETLNLHRNTVQYRLHKAAELLPAPIADRHSDLELALRACDQLGAVLLNSEE